MKRKAILVGLLCLVSLVFMGTVHHEGSFLDNLRYYDSERKVFWADPDIADQGVYQQNSIKYFVDTIGATKKAKIVLKHTDRNNDTTAYQLSTDETITSNLTTKFEEGAVLNTDISVRNATYIWTVSGAGTDEYYLTTAAGGDPGISQPSHCAENDTAMTAAAVGGLAVGEWAWDDNDTLGYDTIYVRLSGGAGPDPDSEAADYVEAGYTLTINGPGDYPDSQWISGTGSVSFGDGAVRTIECDWFPATSAGFQMAVNAAGDYELHLSNTNYDISEITIASRYLSIIGSGMWDTVLTIAAGSDYGLKFNAKMIDGVCKNFYVDGSNLNNAGIGIHAPYGMKRWKWEKVYFYGNGDDTTSNGTGLKIDGAFGGVGNSNENHNEAFQCYFYNWRYGLHLNGTEVAGGLIDSNKVELSYFAHNYTHIRIDDGNDNLLTKNYIFKVTDGGVERAAGTDRVEVDGGYSRLISFGNYWDDLGTQDAIELTNYAGTGEPIIVIGDTGTVLASYVLNSGNVQFLAKDAVSFATLDVVDGLNERKSYDYITAAMSPYTPDDDNEIIFADTVDGDITVELPPLADVANGKTYTIIKVHANNSVIIDADGAERIYNGLTATLTNNFDALTIVKYQSGTYWAAQAFFSSDYTAASTGTGTVLMGSAGNANSDGWLQIIPGKWVPYWNDPTP